MTTDRAKRYAANRNVADDKRAGCLFCHSKQFLTVDHLDGYEENGESGNLAWLCKSCNTRKGAAFRKAGIGRPTNQYNPALCLSPEERRNFTQLGFDFPPRADYDQARTAERKKRQREHAAEPQRRRQEKTAERKAPGGRPTRRTSKAESGNFRSGTGTAGGSAGRGQRSGALARG